MSWFPFEVVVQFVDPTSKKSSTNKVFAWSRPLGQVNFFQGMTPGDFHIDAVRAELLQPHQLASSCASQRRSVIDVHPRLWPELLHSSSADVASRKSYQHATRMIWLVDDKEAA